VFIRVCSLQHMSGSGILIRLEASHEGLFLFDRRRLTPMMKPLFVL